MKVVFPFLQRSNVVIFFLALFCITGWAAENVGPNTRGNKYSGKDSTATSKTSSSTKKDLSCPGDGHGGCDKDLMGMESIRMLHRMLDDDHNGNVDQSESDEFLRDELQYEDGFERQALFHNNDKLISVDDLWKAWKNSHVHNWTVDDVIEWLIQDVDLPQYSHVFHSNDIDGSFLPRLVNATGTLLSALGIRNPVHKQKLSLKAMDTVLFGAPKRVHSYTKDVLLVTSLIIAIGGCWFAYLHHRYSQTQVKKMMKDLESLQKAEEALKKLSNELSEAEKNQKSVPPEKQEEMRMLRQSSIRLKLPHRSSIGGETSPVLSRDGSVVRKEGERRLKQAEEELMSLREALSRAETQLELQQQLESQWCVPGELQAWLQLTYELEQLHYTAKHQAAERQLSAAKEGCDKIKKRNKAFLGSLRMAHSNSLDDIDQSILNARAALEEVKQDLEERRHRWHTVELLCGFSVITNPGLSALKLTLGRDVGGGTSRIPGSVLAPLSIEEGDEDIPPSVFMIQNGIHAANSLLSPGYLGIPATAASKTFLRQQTLAGSTGSLSHAPPPSGGQGQGGPSTGLSALLRRESRESSEQQQHPSAHLSVTNPVAFHLGEGPGSHHERSHSNVSSTGQLRGGNPNSSATITTTNGHYQHNQLQAPPPQPPHSVSHSKLASAGYTQHANSYPPFVQQKSAATSPTSNNNGGMSSHTSSHGNLSHKNGSSIASSYSNFRSGVVANSAAAVSANSINSHHHHHQQQHHPHQHGRMPSPEDHPMYPYHQQQQQHHHRPESLHLNQSLDCTLDSEHLDSPDYGDTGSNTGSHVQSHYSNSLRPPLDRSPEVDVNSIETESLHSASALQVKMSRDSPKKKSKKKNFLPFLRKNSSKQKSS